MEPIYTCGTIFAEHVWRPKIRMMDPSQSPSELILVSLRDGEKTMSELFTLTRLSYSTAQKYLVQLVKDGTVERRWHEEGTRGKYLYKLKG